VVGILDPEVARERDERGEQYAVLLLHRDQPWAVFEISWEHHALTAWRFDSQRRRTARHDLRELADGQLLLIQQKSWTYPDPATPELERTAPRRTRAYSPDGVLRDSEQEHGDLGGTFETVSRVPVESLRHPRPNFGGWAHLAAIIGEVSRTATFSVRQSVPEGVAVSPRQDPPWLPPQPLQPSTLATDFRNGARYRVDDPGSPKDKTEVTAEIRKVGRLNILTGRLKAADPTWLDGVEPFAVEVSPGRYPVALSVIRWTDDPENLRVAAARLEISDEPVASWEPALESDQDPRALGEGQFFGMGVDAGLASFVDAAKADVFREMIEQDLDLLTEIEAGEALVIDDPSSKANLISFPSGWGDGAYPTWIGRTADGDIACFVIDMLLFKGADPVR
jgi:hypothetical protein